MLLKRPHFLLSICPKVAVTTSSLTRLRLPLKRVRRFPAFFAGARLGRTVSQCSLNLAREHCRSGCKLRVYETFAISTHAWPAPGHVLQTRPSSRETLRRAHVPLCQPESRDRQANARAVAGGRTSDSVGERTRFSGWQGGARRDGVAKSWPCDAMDGTLRGKYRRRAYIWTLETRH